MKKINKVGVGCCHPQQWCFMPHNQRKHESRQGMATAEDANSRVHFTDCGSRNAAIVSCDASETVIGWLAHNFTLGLAVLSLQLFFIHFPSCGLANCMLCVTCYALANPPFWKVPVKTALWWGGNLSNWNLCWSTGLINLFSIFHKPRICMGFRDIL